MEIELYKQLIDKYLNQFKNHITNMAKNPEFAEDLTDIFTKMLQIFASADTITNDYIETVIAFAKQNNEFLAMIFKQEQDKANLQQLETILEQFNNEFYNLKTKVTNRNEVK